MDITTKKPKFFGCYLLRSQNPRHKGLTYIGFTVDPKRRIRQHNGEITSGAWRTKKKRPWEMILCLYGFPSQVQALQFEWAWQHPQRSLAVKEAAFKLKSLRGIAGKVLLVFTMLSLPEWKNLELTINFLSSSHVPLSKGCPNLPPQMQIKVGPLEDLPCYSYSSALSDGVGSDTCREEGYDTSDNFGEDDYVLTKNLDQGEQGDHIDASKKRELPNCQADDKSKKVARKRKLTGGIVELKECPHGKERQSKESEKMLPSHQETNSSSKKRKTVFKKGGDHEMSGKEQYQVEERTGLPLEENLKQSSLSLEKPFVVCAEETTLHLKKDFEGQQKCLASPFSAPLCTPTWRADELLTCSNACVAENPKAYNSLKNVSPLCRTPPSSGCKNIDKGPTSLSIECRDVESPRECFHIYLEDSPLWSPPSPIQQAPFSASRCLFESTSEENRENCAKKRDGPSKHSSIITIAPTPEGEKEVVIIDLVDSPA